MSLFRAVETPCPSCGTAVSFELVHSVNADRRPELRAAILDRGFQRETCRSCGEVFRMEPEFTYLDIGAGQWISAWPASRIAEWAALEQRGRETFARFYGSEAAPEAAAIGAGLAPRVTFGWEALREKILARGAAIDDAGLELAKTALYRTYDGLGPGDDAELRLAEIEDGDTLLLLRLLTGLETPLEEIRVPRALLDEIAADPAAWAAQRAALGEGPFLDVARMMMGGAAADAPEPEPRPEAVPAVAEPNMSETIEPATAPALRRRTASAADKVAVVTGSALNIGRAIALALAAQGYRVLVHARDSAADCNETVRLIAEAGGQAMMYLADISDPVQARGLIEMAAQHFGRLDVLVNNASRRRQTPLAEITPEEWREILGSTLDGAFFCAQAAAPLIAASGGGAIVNLGGISAHAGATGRVHALTAKAGMVGLTRALAKELGGQGITVNTVVPGDIETIRGAAAGGNTGRAKLPETLLGRRGRPEEVAAMVAFLCSEEARYITGQTLHVNGGAYLG
ncbi:MAG: SDR family oxidoreductase [Rhodospirillales bacterium]|nr:SDR family oxidoreductase [Rhodospirillales bacterium]